MKKLNSFIRFSVLFALIAVTALSFLSCSKEEAATNGTEITITVAVINKAGETSEHEIKTTAADLGTALVESGLVEDNQDSYGLYILTVNGETADWNVDQSYWSLSKNGEALMTGASATTIADGEHYELTYTISE
jgi:hypothetical protein